VLAERGYHATTLDEIAARAGSSKPTIYRRWTGKPHVVAEAVRHALARANPAIPHTADPRADVRTVLQNVIDALTRTPFGSAVRTLLDAAEAEPELASCLAEVERDRRAVLRAVLTRAMPPTADLELEIDLLLGAIYFRFLVRRTPIPRRLADTLVVRLIR
jgi:AcrR family transcriptional regulator